MAIYGQNLGWSEKSKIPDRLGFSGIKLEGNFYRCVRARAHLRALLTQKSCAVGMQYWGITTKVKLQCCIILYARWCTWKISTHIKRHECVNVCLLSSLFPNFQQCGFFQEIYLHWPHVNAHRDRAFLLKSWTHLNFFASTWVYAIIQPIAFLDFFHVTQLLHIDVILF